MKKIIVPDGMLKSANDAWIACEYEKLDAMRDALEAALLWLSENPIVPTDEQIVLLKRECPTRIEFYRFRWATAEWQRRMFLAPEPEVPEEVKDLLSDGDILCKEGHFNHCILEAFRRGQKSK